jgi:hypothetical protein
LFGWPHKTKTELQRASEELALLERVVALVERVVCLVLTVVLALVSAVSLLLGVHWDIPAGASAGAAALTALGARLRR